MTRVNIVEATMRIGPITESLRRFRVSVRIPAAKPNAAAMNAKAPRSRKPMALSVV